MKHTLASKLCGASIDNQNGISFVFNFVLKSIPVLLLFAYRKIALILHLFVILLLVGSVQGCGACLDQMRPTPSVSYWHRTNYFAYDDDDFQVRLLNKAVQLCYVSIGHTCHTD